MHRRGIEESHFTLKNSTITGFEQSIDRSRKFSNVYQQNIYGSKENRVKRVKLQYSNGQDQIVD